MLNQKWSLLRSVITVVISLILLSMAALPAQAADPISFDGNNIVGTIDDCVMVVAVGDLDNDGDLDIVSASYDFNIYVWENDGTPFSDGWNSLQIGSVSDVIYTLVVGDLDNDGDLDIVTGDGDYYIYIWENDGTPFVGTWNSQEVGTCSDYVKSVAVGDLDNDGWLDIVSGDENYYIYAWQNDQTPFNDSWDSREVKEMGNYVNTVAVGDLDDDGWLDIVSGDNDHYIYVWENDGTPFDDNWDHQEVGECSDYVYVVALGDLDNDGDLDIVTGDDDDYVNIWENDGTPFNDQWSSQLVGEADNGVYTVAVGDLNEDGYLDIVSGTQGGEICTWENDQDPFGGEWSSLIVYNTSSSFEWVNTVTVGDLDDDGDLDIVSGDDEYNVIAHQNDPGDQVVQGAGGEVSAVNRIGLAAPWLVLAGLAAVGAVCIWRRRSTASK